MKKILMVAASVIMATSMVMSPLSVMGDVVSGADDKTTIVEESEFATDGVGGFVARLYRLILDREPEKKGYDYWVEELNSGRKDGAECAAGFFFSDEYKSIEDSKFVKAQYQNLLYYNKDVTKFFLENLYGVFFDREPDEDGMKYWQAHIQNNYDSKKSVFDQFVDSEEWCKICNEFGIKSGSGRKFFEEDDLSMERFVYGLYTECLGRFPDDEGITYWCNKLKNREITGKEIAYQFFFSEEYFEVSRNRYTTYGVEGDPYIEAYYKVFMCRASDKEGLAYWQSVCQKDYEYKNLYLFDGFADSKEFAEKCVSYGIEPGEHINVFGETSDFTKWAMSFVSQGGQYNNLYDFLVNDGNKNKPVFPYVFGGLSLQNGVDCSGTVCNEISQYFGVDMNSIPHHMLTMAQTYATNIDVSQIKPGDLICDYSDDHGWVYPYVGRLGPTYTGAYYDYVISGSYADDEWNTWTVYISPLIDAEGWYEPTNVYIWLEQHPGTARVARVQ